MWNKQLDGGSNELVEVGTGEVRMPHFLGGSSIRTQLTARFIGLTLVASLALTLTAGVGAKHHLRDQLRHRLMAVAATGALLLDAEALARITRRSDESGLDYARVQGQLRSVRQANPGARYVYTMHPGRRGSDWTFGVDAEEDPKLVSHVGDRYDASDTPEIWKALEGPSADRELVQDEWGVWLSGYAPVRDGRGHTIAILGVDMSASEVQRQEQAVLYLMLVTEVFILGLATLVSRQLSRSLLRPILTLVKATQQVAEGDLSGRVEVSGSAEAQSLGQSFNAMVEALQEGRRFKEISGTDFLTGIGNHRHFQERLAEELSRAERRHRPFSLIMLDVDHFRHVNAEYGHQGGDDVLRELGRLLKAAVRSGDMVARYGGEEFAIILPEADGQEVADRLRRAVEGHLFVVRSLGATLGPRVTVSAGVANYPRDGGTTEGLVMAADIALYRAKHLSRNRVCQFADDAGCPVPHLDPAQLHRALQDATGAAVESLAQALDSRDHYTRGHFENVTRISLLLGQALGLPSEAQAKLRLAGMLHDIGKIGVPDAVLSKRGSLSEQEWEMVRAHPSIGASILDKLPMLEEITPLVLGHHEHYDGGGYPAHTAGSDIPLGARIIAVADAYDAMTSDRPYRFAMTHAEALAELRQKAGSQFDPAVVEALERLSTDVVARQEVRWEAVSA
jgi:diguanylate cyclase (GGDEF)-like protein